jgi:hypothetical protein
VTFAAILLLVLFVALRFLAAQRQARPRIEASFDPAATFEPEPRAPRSRATVLPLRSPPAPRPSRVQPPAPAAPVTTPPQRRRKRADGHQAIMRSTHGPGLCSPGAGTKDR